MLEGVDARAPAKFIQEVEFAALEVPTPAVSWTALQLLPKVQRRILPQIFGPVKVTGEGANDSAQCRENCGTLEDSVGGGGIFVGHNRITARRMGTAQQSRWYKNSIGTAGDVGALER